MGFLKMKLRAKKGNYFFKNTYNQKTVFRKATFSQNYIQSENSISKKQLFHSDVIAKPYKNPNRNPSYSHSNHS